MLPSFTSETTATVNFLRHKDKSPNGEAGIVYYRDGHTVSLSDIKLETVEQYVSTRGDSGDERIATSVDHVDLFFDSEFLADGVQLVDSPGLNGVADNHRAITEQQIEASHAAIFMFNADHPGSKTDFEYLGELLKKSHNIFFVLNKINDIKENEGDTVEKVIAGLQNTYKKQFPEESKLPKIWPLAGEAALVARDPDYNIYHEGEKVTTDERRRELLAISRIEAFEERLRKYLYRGERAFAQLSSPVERIILIISQRKNQYEQELSVLENQTGSEELLQKKSELEEKISQMQHDRKSETQGLRDSIDGILRELKEKVGAENKRLLKAILNELNGCEDPDELNDAVNKIQRKITNAQFKLAKSLETELREKMLVVIDEEYEEYSEKININLQMAASSDFEEVHVEICQSTISVDYGLKAYEADMQKRHEQIDRLEESYSSLKEKSFKAKATEKEIARLRDEISELQGRSDTIQSTFVIPDVRYYTEEVYEKEWKEGLFGVIATILTGRKTVTKQVSKTDDSAQKNAKQEREKILNDIENDKNRVNAELRQIKKPEESSESLEWKVEAMKDKIAKLIEEDKKQREEVSAEADKKQKRELQRLRNDITIQTEQIIDDISDRINQYLDQQRRQYTAVCFDMINAQLTARMQQERDRLDKLVEAIETEGTERDEKIIKNKAAVSDAVELLKRCVELQTVLQETLNDHIEQEAI